MALLSHFIFPPQPPHLFLTSPTPQFFRQVPLTAFWLRDLAILLLHHHSWLDTVSQSSFAEFVWLSQYGEQRLRYTDVQAVRAEIAIRVEDLPGYRVEERDDLAEDSVSRCKRVKIELPSSSFRALKAMRTPPPTPGQSVEANRCKASGVSLSPRLNTASQAKEPASQRPSSSNPTDLPSVALDYSNLLMNVAVSFLLLPLAMQGWLTTCHFPGI